MKNIRVYKNLAWLNQLSPGEAEDAFFDCCGSRKWARRMADTRPFVMIENAFENAVRIWGSLKTGEQIEAIRSNKHIDLSDASDGLRNVMRDTNRLYEAKFGFIFILYEGGRSDGQILTICRERLRNPIETEIRIAAEEQRKIIEHKLTDLLEP